MRFGRRKITYYDTEAGFEAEKFAARLLLLLMNEMRASGRRQVVFLCIGTDRSTGGQPGAVDRFASGGRGDRWSGGDRDAGTSGPCSEPGPDAGTYRGTLSGRDHHRRGCRRWPLDHVGLVTLEKGPLRPGLGVRKELAAVGDISITGIVGGAESGIPCFCRASACPWSCAWRTASAAASVSGCGSLGDVSKTFPVRLHRFDMFCGCIMLYFGKNPTKHGFVVRVNIEAAGIWTCRPPEDRTR